MIDAAISAAVAAIPPLWPLASTVAVNPFLGQSHEGLPKVAARLARVAGTRVTMPRAWYAAKIASGEIDEHDLALAISRAQCPAMTVAALKALSQKETADPSALPTIAELAATASGTDWQGIVDDRFGQWASSHFDEGQALWAASDRGSAFAAWRSVATRDLTPEIMGLKRFAGFVAETPESAAAAIERAVDRLGAPSAALETYFHQLLVSLGGWAQLARYRQWQAQLGGADDTTLHDLLAIRLVWEEALFDRFEAAIGQQWAAVLERHAEPLCPSEAQIVDTVLEEAAECAAHRALAARLTAHVPTVAPAAARLHAMFCIDVRSEIFRRALESADPAIRTSGFAGFFGLTASHRRFASDVAEHRLPVLLNAGITTRAGSESDVEEDLVARSRARAARAWGRFKLAAVSSFAFVEAAGPVYVGKLVRDALGLEAKASPVEPMPEFVPPLDLETRIGMAHSVLGAMSLTDGFAPLVMLVGHGANVTNNPHASALHCGACGGYSGEVNARLLAGVLNDPDVRRGLAGRGIAIPAETRFVAGLHDTTTDDVTLYDTGSSDLGEARAWLAAAGRLARGERALRLPAAAGATSIARRSRDWAETRPEWGLAGCRAFIAAPRASTTGRDLQGTAFLHDYAWRGDKGFATLELIMTAPVVVASWISLQYYGSTVAPELFGGGNKLLHNVVGGIGVVEGNGGMLRGGLPWQSVHDGTRLMHDPLRLTVCIEAPREAMTDVLVRHPGVRALFDNRWLHLFALDDEGRMAWRFVGDLEWEAYVPTALTCGATGATERLLAETIDGRDDRP